MLSGQVRCLDKVALLIGNKQYRLEKYRNLKTPETDISDLTHILTSLNFKCVSLINLTKDEVDQAFQYFLTLLGPGVYALFFFAGHGFEMAHSQYLMGTEASAHHNPNLCICAHSLKEKMKEVGAKLSILLLDMCRERINVDPKTPSAYPVFLILSRKPFHQL